MDDMTFCTPIPDPYQTTPELSDCLYRSDLVNYGTKLLHEADEDTFVKIRCLRPKLDELDILFGNYQSPVDLRRKMEEALQSVEYIYTNNNVSCLLQKIGRELEKLQLTFVESSQHSGFASYSNEISSGQCQVQFQARTEEAKMHDKPLNPLNRILKSLRKKKQNSEISFAKYKSKKHFKQADKFADVQRVVSVINYVSHYMKHLERKKLSEDSRLEGINVSLKCLSSFTSDELNATSQLSVNSMIIQGSDTSIGSDRAPRSYPKEHCPIESIVSDPSKYEEKEDELRSISEDSYCSHKSSDISLEEESVDDAISEFRSTDCYKLEDNLPRTCLEPNPSGQAVDTPTQISPKLLKHSTSLEFRDTKGIPTMSRWLTETFHGPVRERPSQPPREVTSDPLTRETTLENMRQLTWRLASMLHLRDLPVRHREMADAGWFYDEDVDEFRCYCCPAARSTVQWSEGDNPASIHQTLSPDCPHFHPTIPDNTTQNEDPRTSEIEEDREDVTMVVSEDEEKGNEETFDEVTCIGDTEALALTDESVRLDVGKLTHVRLREETSTLVSEFPNSKWDLFSTDFAPLDVDMGENVHHGNFEFLSDDSFRHKEEEAFSESLFDDCGVDGDGEVSGTGEELEAFISPLRSFEDNEDYDLSANRLNIVEDVTVFPVPVQDESEMSSVCYIGSYENNEDSGNSGRLPLHHSQELFQASPDLGNDEPHTDINQHSDSEYGPQGEISVHQGSFVGEQLEDSDLITTEDSDLMSDADNT